MTKSQHYEFPDSSGSHPVSPHTAPHSAARDVIARVERRDWQIKNEFRPGQVLGEIYWYLISLDEISPLDVDESTAKKRLVWLEDALATSFDRDTCDELDTAALDGLNAAFLAHQNQSRGGASLFAAPVLEAREVFYLEASYLLARDGE
jgi:hypothetical protein